MAPRFNTAEALACTAKFRIFQSSPRRDTNTNSASIGEVFRRDCLFGLRLECNRFGFDHELAIKLVSKGYRPLEIPVNYWSRSFRQGKKVRVFRDPFGSIWVDVKLRFQRLPRRDLG